MDEEALVEREWEGGGAAAAMPRLLDRCPCGRCANVTLSARWLTRPPRLPRWWDPVLAGRVCVNHPVFNTHLDQYHSCLHDTVLCLTLLALLHELLRSGACPNVEEVGVNGQLRQGQTPVMRAAKECCPEALSALLLNGADPNVIDRDGRTPLFAVGDGADLVFAPTLERELWTFTVWREPPAPAAVGGVAV